MSQAAPARAGENRRLRLRLAVVALAMFGFGYALVPFYEAICAALGVNEFIKADTVQANTQVDGSRARAPRDNAQLRRRKSGAPP